MLWKTWKQELLIILLGGILFIPFLGAVHLFDWDEINFAEAAREMIVTHNYLQVQIDFQPFWEKPPLFFWLQALCMHVFGINEFAARLPDALCGMLGLLILFRIGKRLSGIRFGWIWVMCYAGSVLPQLYCKSGIIDPVFNLFIFLGLLYFARYQQSGFTLRFLFLSGLFAGLAVLTKGPAALLILGLTFFIYYALEKFRKFLPLRDIFLYVLFVALPLCPWLIAEVAQYGTWTLLQFIKYQFALASTEGAGHGGFFGYHFVVLLLGCFPAVIFASGALFRKSPNTPGVQDFRRWMRILFWVDILLFSLIRTKIVHYSSLTYLPLTFLAAYYLHGLRDRWPRYITYWLLIQGAVYGLLLLALPWIWNDRLALLHNIRDPFTGAALHAGSHMPAAIALTGLILCVALVFAARWNRMRNLPAAIAVLFLGTTLMINGVVNFVTPEAEKISQGSMIRFFESKADLPCYSAVLGFKSYAPLFYGKRTEEEVHNPVFLHWLDAKRIAEHHEASWPDPAEYSKQFGDWLYNGDIDKPAYFAAREPGAEKLKANTGLQLLKEENGYVFFERLPPVR